MGKKRMEDLVRIRKAIYLAALFIGLFTTLILSACSKEKEKIKEIKKGAPYRAVGACELYDKLPGDIKKLLDVNYAGKVKLLGVSTDKVAPDKFKINYYWQILGDLDDYNVVFVHFTDAGNTNLFGNDHDFCQKKPFSELKDKFIKETFTVNIPQSAKGQPVSIKIGVYAPEMQSNNRLKIESAGKIPLDDGKTRAFVEKLSL